MSPPIALSAATLIALCSLSSSERSVGNSSLKIISTVSSELLQQTYNLFLLLIIYIIVKISFSPDDLIIL